ncbi:RIX1 domain-containing protein, partial [Cephalotus follicularis]
MTLVSLHTPDKCWAGICLLGLTCQECSSDRFLASYTVWFHKLVQHIQPPADSQFVKVASCTTLSDLLTRLSGFPNAKKDGISHSGKLMQPVLKLLNEDDSEAVWEAAVNLLCTIITCFPASVQRHYDSV